MPDTITDRRITQEEAGQLMVPLELDLISAFKVIQEDILTGMENYEGTPEQYIEKVLNNLTGVGEVGEMAVLKNNGGKPMAKINKACKPGSGEKQNDFISRCIKEEMDKGTPQEEAQGMCYGIWRGEKTKQNIFKGLNVLLKNIIKRIK